MIRCAVTIALVLTPFVASRGDTLSGPSIHSVSVGFNGTYKVGFWTPIRLTVAAGSERPLSGKLHVTLPDGESIPATYVFPIPEIAAGQEKVIWRYVKFGRAGGALRIRLEPTDGPALEMTIRGTVLADGIPSDRTLIVELGDGLDLSQAIQMRGNANQVVHRSVSAAENLPDHLLGYAAVDLLFVVSSREALLGALSENQRLAIESWVELGGKLVVIASTSGETVENVPFSAVLPGTLDRIAVQRQTTGIEQFAAATTRLDRGSTNSIRFEVPMAILRDIDGVVAVAEGFGADQRPAIVTGIVGFGETIFVAFDLSQDPFASWIDRQRLLAAILELAQNTADLQSGQPSSGRTSSRSLGFRDLGGQLRMALEQFQGVSLVPFSLTASLIAIYILIVGPLEYWLLRRWGKSVWTWLTFPVTIVVFLIATYLLTSSWKGETVKANQATIVDADLTRSLVRGTTWMHLFSPNTERLSLDSRITSPILATDHAQRVLIWQGIPGVGFGGMDSGMVSTSFSKPYEVEVDTQAGVRAHVWMEQFPVAVWSSRSFIGQWWGSCQLQDSSDLKVVAEAQLEGVVVNPCSFELRDAYLMHDRWVYPLGNMREGERIDLADRSTVDIQTRLTRRRVLNGRNVMTPWDASGHDVGRILELMMFHEAAKGTNYTGLTHRYHRAIDLTQHLKSGRAILIGRSKQVAADILLNGAESPGENQTHWTYYRLQMPVKVER